jgi:hypothetical protein
MTRWNFLRAAMHDASQHRWWRISLVTILPAYLAAQFVHAVPGWPRDVLTWA